uniref:Uncharacterized protein n=1 Tax=Panagrolaimus sp. ES5 TaxID=591445 RepID=A0AC34F561_9BILA
MTVSFEPDCYSSQDYINYCITKNQTYSTSTLPLACQIGMNRSMDALNDRLIHHGDFTQSLRRQKPSTSSVKLDPFNFAPQLHKRTRSFDGATHFAVISPSSKGGKLSTYGQKSTSTTLTTQKTGAFQATKNFIKKLYNNSTTLPKKLRSGKSSQKLDRIKAATSPFYEMRYPEPEEIPYLPYNIQYEVESDDIGNDEEETEMDIGNEEFDSSVAPSCSSSTSTATTHEKSINGGQNTHDEGIFSGSDEKSQTGSDFTAPSCISSSNRSTIATTTTVNPATTVPPEQFQSWNDLFGHLKKEITEMRARDAQILENLKSVESQLSYVKGIDRSKSEYSPLSRMLNAPTTIPAGSRESTSSSASTSTSTTSNRPPLRSTFV